MDKIPNYQTAATAVIQEYHAFISKSTVLGATDLRDEMLIDTQNNHFLLLSMSWQQKRFVYNVALHLDIIDGEIWVQQNNTEFAVADELIAKGVLRTDIVLGFIAPNVRQYSGFAVS
jgi:XisI protein